MYLNFECVVCGQVKIRRGALCSFCLKKISPFLKIREKEIFGVRHFYLLRWGEEEDAFIRPLIYYLKGKRESHFTEWASLFKNVNEIEGKILVCPPASQKGSSNQAESFSRALSKLFPSASVLSLEAKKGVNQEKKSLTKDQRFKKNWPKNRYIKRLKDNKWIFVDDVLASGSTLKSLIETRGLPDAVLTLIYRPLIGEDEDDENEKSSFYTSSTVLPSSF